MHVACLTSRSMPLASSGDPSGGRHITALYDTIGVGYSDLRRPDPSIEHAIRNGLADAATVVNVGAGTGSYEPQDLSVVAVEPSIRMIGQRPAHAAPVIQATAMALPFASDAFGASLAILTVHHWADRRGGLAELRRVAADRVVIFTWDPGFPGFWLTDYFPEILDIDRPIFPDMDEYQAALGPVTASVVPIPHGCRDGFLCAYWRRPRAYLDERVRSAMSTFAKIGGLSSGLKRLEEDLHSGAWHRRYDEIVVRAEMDLGYRLVVAA